MCPCQVILIVAASQISVATATAAINSTSARPVSIASAQPAFLLRLFGLNSDKNERESSGRFRALRLRLAKRDSSTGGPLNDGKNPHRPSRLAIQNLLDEVRFEDAANSTQNREISFQRSHRQKSSPPAERRFAEKLGELPRRLQVRTTAYTHTEADHKAYGRLTAAGNTLRRDNEYTSAAADWSRVPLGTTFRIKGNPRVYVIDDYGSALVGTNTIDIYHTSLAAMHEWGVREVEIEILKQGDFAKSKRILATRTSHQHCKKMYRALIAMN